MRCHIAIATTAYLAAAITVSFAGPVVLARQSSASRAVQRVAFGSATQVMSPVVVASWITEPTGTTDQLQLLVLWRGAPGWFQRPGGSSGGRSGGHDYTTITYGDVRLTLDYDPSSRVATVQGKTIKVADDNVVFVDDVDSPTGPRVTGTMQIERTMPGSAGQIGLMLRRSPEIMSFLRCDAGREQASLERLCLTNIGTEK